jgi:hypothetical protein
VGQHPIQDTFHGDLSPELSLGWIVFVYLFLLLVLGVELKVLHMIRSAPVLLYFNEDVIHIL